MEPVPSEPGREIADLLRQEGAALRALARGLLGDGHAAEDLVQDAALAALRSPPAGRLGAWLRSVVRNLARMRRRGEARLALREHAAARAVALPAAADVAASSELMRAVGAAVHELDEPFRTVIVLRFLHEQEPQEIARRLEVPLNTVRSRLQRGLAKLRDRLDHDRGGRAAWAVPMLTLLGSGVATSPVAAASLALLTVAGLTMKTKVVIVTACLAVCGLGLAVLWSVALGPTRAEVGAGAAPAAVVTERAASAPLAPAALEHGAGERVALRPDAADAWVVRGVVTDLEARPVAGVRIVAERFLGYAVNGAPRERDELTSAADGKFAWTLEAPPGTVALRFECGRQPGFRPWKRGSEPRFVPRGQAPPQDVVVTAIALDVTVRGRVTDLNGEPVAGAWVQGPLRDETVPCAADGSFALRTTGGAGVAAAPGHAARVFRVAPARGQHEVTLDIRLRRGAKLAGSVLDAEGRPIAGAAVGLQLPQPAEPVLSDPQGRYELTCFDPESSARLVARHPEYVTAMLWVPFGRLPPSLDLMLRRGALVAGRVVGPDDRPVAAAHVRIAEGTVESLETVTHDDGEFVLAHVAPGERTLTTRANEMGRRGSGLAPDQRVLQVPADGERLLGLVVRLSGSRSLAGSVVDEAGAPVPEAVVGAYPSPAAAAPTSRPSPSPQAPITGIGKTDASGRFRIDEMPPQPMRVRATKRGYLDADVEAPATQADLVLRLVRGAGFAGTVLDARTRRPLPRFKIRVFSDRDPVGPFERTVGKEFADPHGEWRVDDISVEAGTVLWVEAWAEGDRPALRQKITAAAVPDPSRLVLALEAAAAVAGRVLDRGGRPVADAAVIPFDEQLLRDPDAQRQRDSQDLERHATRTGDDGRFRIDGLPAGVLTLRVLRREGPAAADGPFATTVGACVERVIVLGDGTQVRGTLLDASGRPVPDVSVVVKGMSVQSGIPNSQQARSDAGGRFAFAERVPDGRFLLTALGEDADGWQVFHAAAVQASGAEVDVAVRPLADTALLGRLQGPDPMPTPLSVDVTCAVPELGALRVQVQARSGVLRVRGLPVGEASVDAAWSAPDAGSWRGRAKVTLAAGRTAEVTVPMQQRR